uniref:Uncharacterized protein n=1 Tax=Laticauda laticaudata TaxID=8630 RepID=A0A8C5S4V5_LATLA
STNTRLSYYTTVSSLAEKLEESVFPVYDHNNKLIQDKLQELSEIMEKIRQIENELKQVCHTVEMMYKDLCGQPEFGPDCVPPPPLPPPAAWRAVLVVAVLTLTCTVQAAQVECADQGASGLLLLLDTVGPCAPATSCAGHAL